MQCNGARGVTGDYRCTECGARWDADDVPPPECIATLNWQTPAMSMLGVRKAPVPERLTTVCEHLRAARAPDILIREIEDCIVALRMRHA